MNKKLKRVSTWFKANKLSVNFYETKWAIFHSTSKKHFIPTRFLELFIDGVALERETVTKFLRVFTDENITWKTLTNIIPTKISKSIGILYKAMIPRKQLNQLYFSLEYSHFKYANLVEVSIQKNKIVYFFIVSKGTQLDY